MWIVRLALRRPYTFVVVAILIVIMGALAIVRTPTDIFPNINIPVVSIIWTYNGLVPEDMADRIVSITERALTTTVDNIEHIESQSLYGIAVVKVFLQPTANIQQGIAQITAVSQTQLKQLPAGSTPPLILAYSASSVPVLQLALSGDTALLDPATARRTADATTPEMLAAGMGATTFMPRRTPADPEIVALAKLFAHNDGIGVLPDTIQYLNERAADETTWLAALSTNKINTSLVWGLHDSVSPIRVANFVWQEFLKNKPGRNRFWVLPTADHYLQCDAPQQLARVVRLTSAAEATSMVPWTVGLTVRCSRTRPRETGQVQRHPTASRTRATTLCRDASSCTGSPSLKLVGTDIGSWTQLMQPA